MANKIVPGASAVFVRMPVDLRTRLEQAAARERRTLTGQVIVFVEEALATRERQENIERAS